MIHKVLQAEFISVGRLFQSKAPVCAKQLWARVAFNRGGLRFILALCIVLPVITETLLHRTQGCRYGGGAAPPGLRDCRQFLEFRAFVGKSRNFLFS